MEKLLEIKNLKKHFIIKGEKAGQNRLRAVDDVSFDVFKSVEDARKIAVGPSAPPMTPKLIFNSPL